MNLRFADEPTRTPRLWEISMSWAQAMTVLDQRRNGRDIPEDVILKALELTGDIEPCGIRIFDEAEA
jgi:hypothetical protein